MYISLENSSHYQKNFILVKFLRVPWLQYQSIKERSRYLIYPRFRYQSPTKGDAMTRRASATRSHEPSRGTELFNISLSLSLPLSPSLPTPPPSSTVSHGTPRSLVPTRRDVCSHTRDGHALDGHSRGPHALVGERSSPRLRSYTHQHARRGSLANDRCIYLFCRFQFQITKRPRRDATQPAQSSFQVDSPFVFSFFLSGELEAQKCTLPACVRRVLAERSFFLIARTCGKIFVRVPKNALWRRIDHSEARTFIFLHVL